MAFSIDMQGHTIMIDAVPQDGGGDTAGPTPKALLLAALGGCTAMDVISILRKMRNEPERFEVTVESGSTDEHPKILKDVVITYSFTGDLSADNVKKAVTLSSEKYCGVSAMLKKSTDIAHRIFINDVEITG